MRNIKDVSLRWNTLMTEIIPAILPTTTEELEEKLNKLPKTFDFVQIDIIDEEIYTDPVINFEVHFMTRTPEEVVDKWVGAGAKRVIVHNLSEKILSLRPEVEIGLGVEIDVELEDIYKLIPEVDFVQLMSIEEIGVQGNEFSPKIFDRIKELRKEFPEVIISIDGGVNLENADDLIHLGVERLVIGSSIFNTDDPEESYKDFLKL